MTKIIPSLDNDLLEEQNGKNVPANPIKVQNQKNFKPLVEINEPNLINLLKFSQIDERRRQKEWQENYAEAMPKLAQTTPTLAKTMPTQVLQKAKLKTAHTKHRRKQSKKKLAYSLLAISLLTLLVVIGLVLWQRQKKPVEMNFKLRLQKYEKSLIAAARESGVWPSVTAAQLYIEAGDGPNKLADLDNNGFGLKWHDNMARRHRNKAWPVTYQTKEYIDGKYVTIDDLFGKFANFEIGIFEHDRIWWNGYHEEARQVLMDLEHGKRADFINGILHYATAPEYRDAIKKVIKEQQLDYLDDLAFPNGRRLQAGFPDLQKKANEEAIKAAVSELRTEKDVKSQNNLSNQAKDSKSNQRQAKDSNKEEQLTEADLSSEQRKTALETVKEKMFKTLGTYPNDGYNVSDLENENLQTALKR